RAKREGMADVQLAAKHPALSALAKRRPKSPKFEIALRALGERRLWAALAGALGLFNQLRLRSAWLRLDAAARAYAYARGQRLRYDGVGRPGGARPPHAAPPPPPGRSLRPRPGEARRRAPGGRRFPLRLARGLLASGATGRRAAGRAPSRAPDRGASPRGD